MSSVAQAFITNGFFTRPQPKYLLHSSFVQQAFSHDPVPMFCRFSRSRSPYQAPKMRRHRFSRSRRRCQSPKMRRHRNQGFSSRPVALKSLEQLQKGAASLWQNASSSERLTICSAGFAAVVLASIAVNALVHISLFLAFSIVPLLLVPILFTFVASLTAFAFLTFATAGAGIFFIGTPFFALAFAAKMLLPVMLIVGATSFIITRLLGLHNNEEEFFETVDEIDDLERFDRALRNRQTPKSDDITRWSINDVIDELDYTGLGGYRQLFIEERIDGPALLDLKYEDIKTEFGNSMPLGDRMRLIRLVSLLRTRTSRLP